MDLPIRSRLRKKVDDLPIRSRLRKKVGNLPIRSRLRKKVGNVRCQQYSELARSSPIDCSESQRDGKMEGTEIFWGGIRDAIPRRIDCSCEQGISNREF